MDPRPSVTVLSDKTELDQAAARLIQGAASRSVSSSGRFTLALSGGSTPRSLHRLLAGEPFRSTLPWKRTALFWVDERCVPPDDPASNYGNAIEDLIEHVPIPRENVFPMPGTLAPDRGAAEYAALLSRELATPPGLFPRLDLVLLGLGRDGHTASLFPDDPALDETGRSVVPVLGGTPRVHRLTMTLPVLKRASRTVFLVAGRDKASAVKAAIELAGSIPPAARVRGNEVWLMDRDAASGIEEPAGWTGTREEAPR